MGETQAGEVGRGEPGHGVVLVRRPANRVRGRCLSAVVGTIARSLSVDQRRELCNCV